MKVDTIVVIRTEIETITRLSISVGESVSRRTSSEAIDAKEIAPNEIRGRAIEGGEAHQISKGDVVVVPAGLPHWFKEVRGPFLYFVCKPIAAADSHLTSR